jgi:hypothetical protein
MVVLAGKTVTMDARLGCRLMGRSRIPRTAIQARLLRLVKRGEMRPELAVPALTRAGRLNIYPTSLALIGGEC